MDTRPCAPPPDHVVSSARYAFAAHSDALGDLRAAPQNIRDLALLELQHRTISLVPLLLVGSPAAAIVASRQGM